MREIFLRNTIDIPVPGTFYLFAGEWTIMSKSRFVIWRRLLLSHPYINSDCMSIFIPESEEEIEIARLSCTE